jgi:hypothetical protein
MGVFMKKYVFSLLAMLAISGHSLAVSIDEVIDVFNEAFAADRLISKQSAKAFLGHFGLASSNNDSPDQIEENIKLFESTIIERIRKTKNTKKEDKKNERIFGDISSYQPKEDLMHEVSDFLKRLEIGRYRFYSNIPATEDVLRRYDAYRMITCFNLDCDADDRVSPQYRENMLAFFDKLKSEAQLHVKKTRESFSFRFPRVARTLKVATYGVLLTGLLMSAYYGYQNRAAIQPIVMDYFHKLPYWLQDQCDKVVHGFGGDLETSTELARRLANEACNAEINAYNGMSTFQKIGNSVYNLFGRGIKAPICLIK